MRTDHLMMLFPLGLEAPSPWVPVGDPAAPVSEAAPVRERPRARSFTLGLFLLCPFRPAVCSR